MDHREMLLALAAEAELQRKYAEAAAADAERWDTDQWCGGCEHYDRGGYEPENGYHAPATCNYAWQQEADGHLDEATTADYELALFCLSKRNACPHAFRPLPAPRRSILDPVPPDPEGMNDQRAALAEAVVVRFIDDAQTDRECALTDLLADLLHWCDRHGVNFTIELELAREHYAAETTDATGGAA